MGHLLPFYPLPPKNPKNQNFEKMNKVAGDIISHKCTKNHNHMRYSFWDSEWDRQNFLSFWAIFCHFTPLTTGKIKTLKKWKKKTTGDVIILHMCTKNQSYDLCFLRYGIRQDIIFCHFGPFFALLPHYWSQKYKFGINIKSLVILSYYTCVS